VLSVRSRQGIAGASISFASAGVVETIASGADGSFRFTPTHDGNYELVGLSATGFVPQIATPGEGDVRFSATRGVSVSGVELFLDPVREVMATVVDDGGRPVPGAVVRVDGGGGAQVVLATDGAGRCRFAASPGMLVEATSKGRRAFARLEPPMITRGSIVLELVSARSREAPIRGVVLDTEGRPVADVTVVTQAEDQNGSQVKHEASTSLDGRFVFEPLLDGSYVVVARTSGRVPAVARGVRPGTAEVIFASSQAGRFAAPFRVARAES